MPSRPRAGRHPVVGDERVRLSWLVNSSPRLERCSTAPRADAGRWYGGRVVTVSRLSWSMNEQQRSTGSRGHRPVCHVRDRPVDALPDRDGGVRRVRRRIANRATPPRNTRTSRWSRSRQSPNSPDRRSPLFTPSDQQQSRPPTRNRPSQPDAEDNRGGAPCERKRSCCQSRWECAGRDAAPDAGPEAGGVQTVRYEHVEPARRPSWLIRGRSWARSPVEWAR